MTTSPRRASRLLIVPMAGLLIGTAACGDDDSSTSTTAPSTETSVDNGDGDNGDGEWSEAQIEEARENARGYLGLYEDDLPVDVRVARRGDEMFALTADYVLGRSTVELDDVDGSGYRVVTVIVELPGGSESFDLDAG